MVGFHAAKESDLLSCGSSRNPTHVPRVNAKTSVTAAMDPTKLRSRGFNSAADANRKKAAASDQSLWTETPAERAQRLADEASGKKRRIENAEDTSTPEEQDARRKKKKRDAAIAKDLEELNVRPSSTPL